MKTRVRLWQAGDMPGKGNNINLGQTKRLVKALQGLEAWGYTHKPLYVGRNAEAIKHCNDNDVAINLSANSLKHADELLSKKIAPVTITLPTDAVEEKVINGKKVITSKRIKTPNGVPVVMCPAVLSDSVTCSICGGSKGALCARTKRNFIVGFPAHGASSKKVSNIVRD